MKTLMPIVSWAGLALVMAPAVAYLAGSIEKSVMNASMLLGTIVWFGSVPFWMERDRS